MAETIKTLKPSGGDYTSISAWVAGEAGALGVDEVAVLECYKGDYTGSGGDINQIVDDSVISGWSNLTPTAYPEIRTPLTERHTGTSYEADGITHTGFCVHKASVAENSYCMFLSDRYARVTGLIFTQSQTGGYGGLGGIQCGINNGQGNNTVSHNIFVSETNAVSGAKKISGIGIWARAAYYTNLSHYIFNNLVYGLDDGISGSWDTGISSPGSDIFNNTCVGCNYPFSADKPSNEYANLKNNIAEALTGGACYSGAGIAGDYNLASDTSAPGVNSVQSTTLMYTDAANDDYSLAASDTTAIDAGVDDPSSGKYLDDIISIARVSPWDMGAFEYVASGGTTYLQTLQYSSLASVNYQKQAEKTFSSSSTSNSFLQKSSLFARLLSISSSGIISLQKFLDKILSTTTLGISSLSTLKVLLRTLTTTSGSVLSIVKQAIFSRILSLVVLGTPQLIKKLLKLLTPSPVGVLTTITKVKVLLKSLITTSIGVATLSKLKVLLRALTASATSTVSLTKSLLKTLVISVSTLSNLARGLHKTLVTSVSSVVNLFKLKVLLKVLIASSISLSSLNFTNIFNRVLLASSNVLVSLKRLISKTILIGSNSNSILNKFFNKSLSSLVGSITTLHKLKAVIVNLIVTSTALVSDIRKQISKILSSISSGTVTLQRKMFKILSSAVTTVTSFVKEIRKTLVASVIPLITLNPVYLGSVVLIRNIISKIARFTRVKNNDTTF